MKISITEFLQDKIKCPYLTKTDYNDQKTKYDLTDAAERGQYLHNYVANYLDRRIKFKRVESAYNIKANNAIKWIKETFPGIKFTAEQPITKYLFRNTDIAITGKPDAYSINNNELIVIDFKFSKLFKPYYLEQIVFYAGYLTEQNTEIETIKLYIKMDDEVIPYLYTRSYLLQHYESIIERAKEYTRNAKWTPCDECDRCKSKTCVAAIEQGAFDILNTVSDTDNVELSDEEMKDILYALLIMKNALDAYKGDNAKETKGRFDGKNPEAIALVRKLSKGKAEIKTVESITVKEAEKYLTDAQMDKFRTIKNSEKINDIARKYCNWNS